MEKVFQDRIQEYLLKDEKVFWVGNPDVKKIFTLIDIILIPITTIWGIGMIMMEVGSILMMINPTSMHQNDSSSTLGVALALFEIPFIIFAFYATIGRFIRKKKYKKNTIYVVTDKRVFILSNYGTRKKVIEESIDKITNIYISVNKFGNGTLKFGEIISPNKFLISSPFIEPFMFPIEEIPVFYDIDDAEKVYTLVNSKMNTK
jgi:hypothetical protein